ncbi:MAG: GGDEF domain-containing protein, partial [Desulfosalsimonas sp.]
MEAEEKKRMNLFEALKENPGHVSAFFDVSAECIAVVTDENYRIVSFNTNFARLPGLSENPVGRRLEDLLCLLEEGEFSLLVSGEAGNVFPQMLRVCHTGILYKCYTFAIQGGVLLLGERLGATDNETLQTMSLLNNELSVLSRELGKKNRELEKAYSRITELSRTDALTGLSNRRYFNERYEEEFALSQRHGFALSVAMMDLDFFKRVNDNLGHNRGDEVLVAFADILRRNCRLEDFPSRFGGEEFIVF